MPYITQSQRQKFNIALNELTNKIADEGELNYIISSICHLYLSEHGTRYRNFNTVIGALESAKLELYRQIVGPYEDIKAKEHGFLEIPKKEIDKGPGC